VAVEGPMTFRRLVRTQWDRCTAAVLVVGGLLALLLGWIGVSGTVLAYRQIPYVISGGIVGLGLIVIGTGVWLSADLHDEWRKLDRLEERLANVATVETRLPDETRLPGAPDHPDRQEHPQAVPPATAVRGGTR